METRYVAPALRIRGEASLPGDKSIAHRAALIGAISEGTTTAHNFPGGADCQSTLRCLEQLGVELSREAGTIRVHGRGLGGLLRPDGPLDAGNSGTTARLLSGILSGHAFRSIIVGDESLSRRPMTRIVEPLTLFGARIDASDGRLPLHIEGGRLRAISYRLPVPSAQVKSAILLAGSHASGITAVEEPFATRDHTEIALLAAGARLRRAPNRVEIEGGRKLLARTFTVPADVSSAAFFMAAALGLPDSEVRLSGVGCNPTRTGFCDVLNRIGGAIIWNRRHDEGGEAVGDVVVRSSRIGKIMVDASLVPSLVDELPMLAVLGAVSGQGAEIRGAGELRHKETDRIHAVVANLAAIGCDAEELDDGMRVGAAPVLGGEVESFGDHRIAMAFAIAGLMSREGVTIENPGCVDISFPGFFDLLDRMVER